MTGWVGLDLRHLLTFQAIAEEGSFKAAARALGYTPSAVSQQIATLERVVGAQLIAREQGRQAFGLTEAGTILLRHLTAIEARLGAARADIDALTQGAAGTLRVGAYESVGTRLLPELIGRFGERFPDIRIDVVEALSDLDHLRALEQGSLDVAFTLQPLPPGPYRTRSVLRDPWVLVVQRGSTLLERVRRPFELTTLARLPLICFRAPRSIDDVLDRLRVVDPEPNIVLQSDYNDAVQEFAAAGRGVAIMPLLCVNARDDRTEIVELGDLIPPREIALAWHADRAASEALDAFVELGAHVAARVEAAEASVFRIDRAGGRGPDSLRASNVSDHDEPLRRARAAGSAGGT